MALMREALTRGEEMALEADDQEALALFRKVRTATCENCARFKRYASYGPWLIEIHPAEKCSGIGISGPCFAWRKKE